ncbi:MAG: hypothetical protein ACLQDV_01305 [Candidatus Binataceae bacterium]
MDSKRKDRIVAQGAAGAIEAINGDYDRHARTASAIAEEYFSAEKLLDPIAEAIGA